MRALAHPARLAILEHLAVNEAGATATECAEVVGLSPSATSYHLRAMAKAGLINEAPSRGDGRERVWQRKFVHYEVSGKGEGHSDELAMAEAILAHQNDKVRRFLSDPREQSGQWYEVATMTDSTLVMTADELAALLAKIHEMVDPYRRRVRTDPPPGARTVTLQLRGMPLIPLREGDVK